MSQQWLRIDHPGFPKDMQRFRLIDPTAEILGGSTVEATRSHVGAPTLSNSRSGPASINEPTLESSSLDSDALGIRDEDARDFKYVVTLQHGEFGRGRIGRVYRGSLSSEDADDSDHDQDGGTSSSSGPGPLQQSVVLKLVAPRLRLDRSKVWGSHTQYHPSQTRTPELVQQLFESLRHEATLYEGCMKELQGVVVPRCLGYGVSENGDARALLLEDVGTALKFPFRRLPLEDRSVSILVGAFIDAFIETDSKRCLMLFSGWAEAVDGHFSTIKSFYTERGSLTEMWLDVISPSASVAIFGSSTSTVQQRTHVQTSVQQLLIPSHTQGQIIPLLATS